jgi:hypothetical protein
MSDYSKIKTAKEEKKRKASILPSEEKRKEDRKARMKGSYREEWKCPYTCGRLEDIGWPCHHKFDKPRPGSVLGKCTSCKAIQLHITPCDICKKQRCGACLMGCWHANCDRQICDWCLREGPSKDGQVKIYCKKGKGCRAPASAATTS